MANIYKKSFDFGDGNRYFPLPIVTADQNGMVMKVVDGEWIPAEMVTAVPLIPGLYAADGAFTSWNELVAAGSITLDDRLYITDCDTALAGKLIISDSVTGIDNTAFMNCVGLTAIVIPGSVVAINNYAFRGCNGLTSIVIPDSVSVVGNTLTYGCTSLTDVYYTGTEEQWATFVKWQEEDSPLRSATIHYNYTGDGSELA